MDRNAPELTAPSGREPWTRLLLLLLAGSAALRAWLVMRGGQLFWMDELRYHTAREGIERLAAGDYAGFGQRLLGGADHLLFKVLALLPAAIQGRSGDSLLIPGFFCAAFSVANIYLLWRIARAAGASPREAFGAALLLAVANTNFYYARHLLPYDAALTFGLLALLAGWMGDGWRRSLGCGLLAGLAFLTYNGCWLFGAVVLTGHVLRAWPDRKQAAVRAGVAALGLALPVMFFIVLARWTARVDLVASFVDFSHSINQGDFGRGGKLLFEYFWSAEKGNAVLGLLGLLLAAGGALAARRWHYGMRWVLGALGVVAGLVLFSDVWPKFVIYGRTARQIVPFACLAGAFALERLWRTGGGGRRAAGVVLILVLAQAAANFSAPLQQVFAPEFKEQAAAVSRQRLAQRETRQLLVIYADRLLGKRGLLEGLPDHDVLLAADNPLQFSPYLFEGYTEELRDLLHQSDIRMRLIAINAARFNQPTDLRQPHPGVVQLKLRLPQDKPAGREPLLVTGKTGAGDLVYVIYDSPTTIRLGFDHWGYAGTESGPVPVDYSKPVVVTLSLGALHPEHPAPDENGANGVDLHHWLYAEVNGQVVWSRPAEFHPTPPATLSFGKNYIGGSTCDQSFTGKILRVDSLLLPPPIRADSPGR